MNMSKSERRARAKRLAHEIAEDLFTNTMGRASMLVMVDADGHNLGGWGQGPAQDRIAKILTQAFKEFRSEAS